jgi:hypothetical protein
MAALLFCKKDDVKDPWKLTMLLDHYFPISGDDGVRRQAMFCGDDGRPIEMSMINTILVRDDYADEESWIKATDDVLGLPGHEGKTELMKKIATVLDLSPEAVERMRLEKDVDAFVVTLDRVWAICWHRRGETIATA